MTQLKQLQAVDLSSNGYQGPLPQLANLSALQALNLHDNALTSARTPHLKSKLLLLIHAPPLAAQLDSPWQQHALSANGRGGI
jgi:hypothetical protein